MRFKPIFFIILSWIVWLEAANAQPAIVAAAFTKFDAMSWAAGAADIAEFNRPAGIFLNPAGIITEVPHLCLEFSSDFGQPEFNADITLADQTMLPSFAAYQRPIQDHAALTVGYARLLRQEIDYPEWEITTEEDPDGTGIFVDPQLEYNIYTFFAAGAYSLSENSTIGLAAGLNFWRGRRELLSTKITSDETGFYLTVGYIQTLTDKANVGLAIQLGRDFNQTDTSYNGNRLDISDVIVDPDNPAQISLPSFLDLPNSFKAGASYYLTERLTVMAMLNFTDWSPVADYDSSIDFHTGLEARVSANMLARCGFFTQNEPTESLGFDQKFLTTGLQWSFGRLKLNGMVMDSHLFKNNTGKSQGSDESDNFHQTRLTFGLLYAISG